MTPPSPSSGWRRAAESPTRYPRAAFLVLILCATLGATFGVRIPLDRSPLSAVPTLAVRAELPGMDAATVETEVTRPLEDALAGLSGLREIEARSRAGRAEIALRFAAAGVRDGALREVRRRLDRSAVLLPPSVDRPVAAPSESGTVPAIIYAVVANELSEAVISWTRNVLADPLREFAHVDSVTVEGAERREVLIQPAPRRLAALGLGFDDLVLSLRGHGEAPQRNEARGATITSGGVEAIAARAVRLPNGEPIALSEVAQVSIVERPATEASDTARLPALRLAVYTRSSPEAAAIAERTRAHLAWLRANDLVPRGVAIHSLHDEAQARKAWRLRVLSRIGLCVAGILAFLFLAFGIRFAGIAAAGFAVWLPVSVAALWILGFALDLATVAGLLLACAPFTLLIVLPLSGMVFLFTLLGAIAFWLVGLALGAPYASTLAVIAVAPLLGGPIRWLMTPWVRSPEAVVPWRRVWPGKRGATPLRFAASVVAAAVLITVAASIYALPGVNAVDGGGTFALRLRGDDPRRLAVVAGSLLPGLHAVPRVSDVSSSAALVETWRLRLDRERMAALGVELARVGRAFAIARQGLIVGEIVHGETRLRLRLQQARGVAGDSFERLLLRGERENEPAVYLRDIGTAERAPQPRERLRVNGEPAVEISARWHHRGARAALLRFCRRIELPEGDEADCRVIDAPTF